MVVDRKIEITSIVFGEDRVGAGMQRTASVQWRVSSQDGRQEFTIPMVFFINSDRREEDVVASAKAAFHALTAHLADQTKAWAGPE